MATVLQDPTATAAAALASSLGTASLTPAEAAIYGGLSSAELGELVQIATTKYDMLTVWSPDGWSILLLFSLAIAMKLALGALVSPAAVKRALGDSHVDDPAARKRQRDLTRAGLSQVGRSILSHGVNLVISTVCLALQLVSWRAFCLPGAAITYRDYTRLAFVVKLLLIGYGADMLFTDLNPSIYIHHVSTFLLLFVGQIVVFETKEYKFFQFAQWLLLQATTEQTTYAAMALYHYSSYLHTQANHLPRLRRTCLSISWRLMVFTKVITYPQKLAPLAFALYWLSRMWHEMMLTGWGRAWLGLSTTLLVLLCAMQVYFCDQVFPLADHVGWKLHGGEERSHLGPLAKRLLPPRNSSRRGRARTPSSLETAAPSPALSEEGKKVSFEGQYALPQVL